MIESGCTQTVPKHILKNKEEVLVKNITNFPGYLGIYIEYLEDTLSVLMYWIF